MSYSPLEQFDIIPLISCNLFLLDFTITNSSVILLLSIAIFYTIIQILKNKLTVVPFSWQNSLELLYGFVYNLVAENIGKSEIKYFPLILTLFLFLLLNNLLGMIPYCFTPTSHISTTFFLSFGFFLGFTFLGINKHRILFFNNFFPAATPYEMAPLLVAIETISYVSKTFSLAIRLFANMMSGHTLLKIIASFAWTMFSTGGMLALLGILPFLLLFLLTGLELGIGILQAYVFTILICIYISDSVHLH